MNPAVFASQSVGKIIPPRLQSKAFLHYSYLRSLLYLVEGFPILTLIRKVTQQDFPKAPRKYVQALAKETQSLLEKDARLVERGILKLDHAVPPDVGNHIKSLILLWADLPKVLRRRLGRKHKEVSAKVLADELPEYYLRNFHFQTDGYLSEDSARIYDHQVEILFRGTAMAMRRILLNPFYEYLEKFPGRSLRILELGCGAGSGTQTLLRAFPQIKITALDLSRSYLKVGQDRLRDFENVDFIQGDAAHLPFQDNSFDGVVSFFLFHELPEDVRLQVLQESKRVTRSGGFVGLVDSLQKGDNPNLEWGLEQFPKDFHEPFYRNYTLKPLEEQMLQVFDTKAEKDLGFFSKVLSLEVSKP